MSTSSGSVTPIESPPKLSRRLCADELVEEQATALGAVPEGPESEEKEEASSGFSDSEDAREELEGHTAAGGEKGKAADAIAEGEVRPPIGPLEGRWSGAPPRDAKAELDHTGGEHAKAGERDAADKRKKAKKEQAATDELGKTKREEAADATAKGEGKEFSPMGPLEGPWSGAPLLDPNEPEKDP